MKKLITLVLLILALISFLVPDVKAQWVETNGPADADILCTVVAGGNGSPAMLYAGSYFDGILLSTDSGANWITVDSGLPPDIVVQALAVNETNASSPIVFAGTDSGVYRSTNKGVSWASIDSGLTYPGIYALAVSGSILFAGTFEGGVFRSTNNGASWTVASSGLPQNTWVTALLAADTKSASPMLFAGTGSGAYRSTNNGTSWNEINNGITGSMLTIPSFAIDGTSTSAPMLFAGTGNGVFLSTDNGSNWAGINNGLSISSISALAVSNMDSSGASTMLFAATVGSVFLSFNNGASWQDVSEGLPATFVYTLAVCGGYLIAGTAGDIWRRSLSEIAAYASVEPILTAEPSLTTYPNPFTQSTTINFTSPENGVATVAIVNILGAAVARIFSGELDAGTHSFMWSKPSGLLAGVYECIVQMNGKVERTAMVVN